MGRELLSLLEKYLGFTGEVINIQQVKHIFMKLQILKMAYGLSMKLIDAIMINHYFNYATRTTGGYVDFDYFRVSDDGWYYIKNVNAQKYLTVKDNVAKAGKNVELVQGLGIQGQKWYLKNVGDGYVTLTSAVGDYMLDISGGKNEDGSNVCQWSYGGGSNQQWNFEKI